MFHRGLIMTLGAVSIPEGIPMSMFVALDHKGRLITINQAPRGLACNCCCVSCGEPVVARQGAVREHHFAHHSNKESCSIQRESLLHLYAKEVICDALGLQLPPLPGIPPANEDSSSWWDFAKVEEEVLQPAGFQPDLVAHLKDGSQLFVEVAVTSFIGEEKLERIKAAGTMTVEIDLSDLLQGGEMVPSASVKEQILKFVLNKTWIYPEATPVAQSHAAGIQPLTSPIATAVQPVSYKEHRFTVMGMWVTARILPTGSVAVRSWSFNPQLAELFKSWRNQLGGEFNPKYRNWIYYPHAADEVLARLQRLDAQ